MNDDDWIETEETGVEQNTQACCNKTPHKVTVAHMTKSNHHLSGRNV